LRSHSKKLDEKVTQLELEKVSLKKTNDQFKRELNYCKDIQETHGKKNTLNPKYILEH
jgi:exonuclease VII small subunit